MLKYIFASFCFIIQTGLFAQHINQSAIQSLKVTSAGAVNSSASEFSPFLLDGQIVFVTEGAENRETDKKIGERFWDLRQAISQGSGHLIPANYLNEKINSPYHEGPLSFNRLDSSLYFTRDYYSNGKLREGSDKKVYLQIYKSKKTGNDWGRAERLAFMDNDVNICHPTIVPEDSVMIFSSNKPGGFGGMDLYEIPLSATSLDEAVNLGPQINSSANEVFPYYHGKGMLVFSSDNQRGEFRNYDLYLTNRNTAYTTNEKLEGGFQTPQDDLGIFIYPDAKSGYFTSSRVGGQGRDDLYYFTSEEAIFNIEVPVEAKDETTLVEEIIQKDIAAKVSLNMIVKHADLSNVGPVNVRIFRDNKRTLVKSYSNVSGPLKIESLDQGVTYDVEIEKAGYYTHYRRLYSTQAYEELLILMDRKNTAPPVVNPSPVVIPVNVGEVVIFEHIYYEYNSDQIKSGSADELDALVRAMQQKPTMKVRLAAHTDSRGSQSYNQLLSERRARSAKEYLVLKGISSSRITTIGFGETQIRNHCRDGVNCSERAHRFNRRTEVQVVEQ